MNFINEQKSELVAAQLEEALRRMKKLGLLEEVLKEFSEEGRLYRSESGILFYLSKQEMVEKWQKETGFIVYHVIKSQMEFGLCYSFLYVSNYQDEWRMENRELEEGCPIVYVKNVDDEICSEFGSIEIRPVCGGIVRIA